MAGVNIGRMLPDWADYGKFVDFAKSGDVGDKTLVVGTPSNLVKATGDRIGKLRRTDAEKEANNGVRDLFRTSVLKLFRLKPNEESKLPASVKKAMELDDNNKGKPLSVRRIKTVDAAIRKLVAADLGKKLSVSPDFERGELFGQEGDQGKGGAQLACKVFGNRKAYDGVLGQISMDVYRDSKSRIPEKERKRFVAEPYCMCNGQKGPLFGFMVNGRQVPVPKKSGDTAEIERFVNLSLAKELTERKPIKRLLLNGERPGDFIPLKPADPLAGNGGVGLIVTGKNAR